MSPEGVSRGTRTYDGLLDGGALVGPRREPAPRFLNQAQQVVFPPLRVRLRARPERVREYRGFSLQEGEAALVEYGAYGGGRGNGRGRGRRSGGDEGLEETGTGTGTELAQSAPPQEGGRGSRPHLRRCGWEAAKGRMSGQRHCFRASPRCDWMNHESTRRGRGRGSVWALWGIPSPAVRPVRFCFDGQDVCFGRLDLSRPPIVVDSNSFFFLRIHLLSVRHVSLAQPRRAPSGQAAGRRGLSRTPFRPPADWTRAR
jgi:hypothetical protein